MDVIKQYPQGFDLLTTKGTLLLFYGIHFRPTDPKIFLKAPAYTNPPKSAPACALLIFQGNFFKASFVHESGSTAPPLYFNQQNLTEL